jgi:Amt family ammonium transporter
MMNGIKRGLYSNEAGIGSAPNAAASADVSHPVKQGLVQMLSVFIDTILICSATAFMILCTGLDAANYVDAAGNTMTGLFYGGGVKLLGIQLLGMGATAAWTAVTITVTFLIIKAIFGLRASEEEELTGLDVTEHGLASAYSGFSLMDVSGSMMEENENTDLGTAEYAEASEAQKNAAVKVAVAPELDTGMHKVVIIAKLSRYDKLRKAMNDLGVTGMTVTQVMGCGIQKGAGEKYRGVEVDATLLPKIKVEVVVSKIPVEKVIEKAKEVLYTGHIGDGKIFVYNVGKVVKIRTGEENYAALQDVE